MNANKPAFRLSKKLKNKTIASHFIYYENSLRSILKLPDLEGQYYICPLCVNKTLVFKNERFFFNGSFTVEHVPPRCLKGTFETITCEECNNKQSNDEEELRRYVTFQAILLAKSKDKIEVTISNDKVSKVKAKLTRTKNDILTLDFEEKAVRFNPDTIKLLDEYTLGKAFNLTFNWDINKINRALLKTIYLFCFVTWKYEFIDSPTAAIIREILDNKKNLGFRLPITISNAYEGNKPSILGAYFQNGYKCFWGMIPLSTKDKTLLLSIPIPPSIENSWQEMEKHFENWNYKIDSPPKLYSLVDLGADENYVYTKQWNQFSENIKV